MRIWVAYKFRGASLKELRAALGLLDDVLTASGHDMFTMIGSIQDWDPDGMPKAKAVQRAYELMQTCDLGVYIYTTADPSEGRGWDIGYMAGLGKPTVMAVHKDVSLPYTEALFTENTANAREGVQAVTRFSSIERMPPQVRTVLRKIERLQSEERGQPEWIKELYGD